MPVQHGLRLDNNNGIQHRGEQMVQPDQNQPIDSPQADPLSRLAAHTRSRWRRTKISASRAAPPSNTERSASKTRVTNANIARCSNTPAVLRHADEVLTSDRRLTKVEDAAETQW